MNKFLHISRIALAIVSLILAIGFYVKGDIAFGTLWLIICMDDVNMLLDDSIIRNQKKTIEELKERLK